MFVDKLKKINKKTAIILGVVVLVLAVIGSQMVFGGRKSEAQLKKEYDIANFVLSGWRIKNDARLESNKPNVTAFKQKLMNYYDAESGALAEQQRLINALIATDEAAATDDNSGEKVLSFDISDAELKEVKIGADKANVTADVEYFIRYETLTQNYSTFGKNRYIWQLKKDGKDWKIIKEELIPGDD